MNPSFFVSAWLGGGKYYLKSGAYILLEVYRIKYLWLNLDHSCGLHEAADLALVPFDKSRDACFKYIDSACDLLGRPRPGWALTADDAKKVTSALGDPPFASYSIYIMTVSDPDGTNERAVYVGQTNAQSQRFRGGHAAISKLHNPIYDGLKKRIHFGCVSATNNDDNTIPIEWVTPFNIRKEILDSVEYQLIFDLKPPLNNQGVHEYIASRPKRIYVQNPSEKFLDGQSFGPLEEE